MDLLRRIFLRILHISPIANVVQKVFPKVINGKRLELTIEEAREHVDSRVQKPNSRTYYDVPLAEKRDTGMDLSVVIPVYNAEQYLTECFESVVSQQTKFKYEIVLVNDGSNDKSAQICDVWKEKYSNIQVIHQKNAGAAVARNTGVASANGTYIMYLDADDCLYENAIETLMVKATENDADIVEGSYQILMGNTNNTRKGIKHANKEGKCGEDMYGFPWGKVFKRKLFLQFCFPADYWGEDAIIANLIFPTANKTITISDDIVKYRITSTGLTAQLQKNVKCMHLYFIMEALLEAYEKFNVDYNKNLTVRQLGQYLYTRCRTLDEKDIQAVFVLAADLAEKFELSTGEENYSFYEKQILEALKNRQYKRWKWASVLI